MAKLANFYLARILAALFILFGASCKSTGGRLGSDGSSEGSKSEIMLPKECIAIDRQVKKVDGLISDYAKADQLVSQDDSESLEIIDPERADIIANYKRQVEELRQISATCTLRTLSLNEDCAFAGSTRAGSDEPCQCYRLLTDSFENGVSAQTAGKDSTSCSEYFSKTTIGVPDKDQQEVFLGNEKSPPKISQTIDRDFGGCLCGTSGNECIMWRPGEKIAESWIDGTCNAELCKLLSQSAPACALLYRLVETN